MIKSFTCIPYIFPSRAADTDKSGSLELEEVKAVMKKAGHTEKKSEVGKMMQKFQQHSHIVQYSLMASLGHSLHAVSKKVWIFQESLKFQEKSLNFQ